MDKLSDIVTEANRLKVMDILHRHVGAANAISMTELFELVFERTWFDRVNDTRPIRVLVTAMRNEGRAICSSQSRNGGGYYLAAASSELSDFIRKDKISALTVLKRDAAMLNISLPEYLGQLKLEMETNPNDKAA